MKNAGSETSPFKRRRDSREWEEKKMEGLNVIGNNDIRLTTIYYIMVELDHPEMGKYPRPRDRIKGWYRRKTPLGFPLEGQTKRGGDFGIKRSFFEGNWGKFVRERGAGN